MKVLIIRMLVAVAAILPYTTIGQVQYNLDAENSAIVIKGTSTIHDWEMHVEEVDGSFLLKDENNLEEIISGDLIVEVKSIKSDRNTMNNKAYDALKEKKHPQIKVRLLGVEQNGATGKVDIELSIAGKTRKVSDEFSINASDGSPMKIKGELNIKMSDFEVEPPVALMGTIKTGDEVIIVYDLTYRKADKTN